MNSALPLKAAAAVIAVLMVLSCAPKLGVQRLDTVDRPPNTGRLDVFESKDAVGQPYKVIALLNAEDKQRVREKRKDQYMEQVVQTAKTLGAEGVIIVERGQRTQRSPDGLGGYVEFTINRVRAEAIVYE